MNKKRFRLKRSALIAASISFIFADNTGFANPTGAQVVNGAVSFGRPNASTLSVTNSPGSIINWQGFSIGASEVTRFIQQSASSAVLNRVVGGNISQIQGQLLSNGRVFLINPSGIVVGPGAVIDTAGFVGSTLNMLDADFLAGKLKFQGDGTPGSIVNQGWIRTGYGGQVILVAPQIENSGLIHTPGGELILAAGKSLTIASLDLEGVQFEVQAPTDSVLNVGKLLADGGAVGVFAGTLRHSGEIRATSLSLDATGQIVLKASGNIELGQGSTTDASGPRGGRINIQAADTTLVSGKVDATGVMGAGGAIHILGNKVGLLDGARVDASGDAGGGTVLVGGDYRGHNPAIRNAQFTYFGPDAGIKADAINSGDGGKVIVWADDTTRAYGAISVRGGAQGGNGGFVETSARHLEVTRAPDIAAPNGNGGTWLLDPEKITVTTTDLNISPATPFVPITSGPANLNVSTLKTALMGGNVVVDTTGGTGPASSADIDFNALLDINGIGTRTLTSHAGNNINFNATGGITDSVAGGDSLNLVLRPGFGVSFPFAQTANINTNLNLGALGGITATVAGGGTGRVTLNSGTVTANGLSTIDRFTMNGGTWTGSGNLDVPLSLNWDGGAISGNGMLTTGTPLAFSSHSVGGPVMLNRNWTTNGDLCICGGQLTIGSGATLTIAPTGELSVMSNVAQQITGAGTLVNNGEINNSNFDGSDFDVDIAPAVFTNNGTLLVDESHVFKVHGGSGSGTYDILNAGGTLAFVGGTRTISGSGSVSGLGSVQFSGGNVTFGTGTTYNPTGATTVSAGTATFNQAAVSFPALTVSGGTLGGSANLSVTGAFGWSGGTIGGSGTLSGGPNVSFSGSGARVLDGKTFTASALTLPGGSLEVRSGTMNVSGATAINPGATLQWTGGTFAPAGTINNNGIFDMGAGAGNLALGSGQVFNNGGALNSAGNHEIGGSTGPFFTNTGSVNVNSGTLSLLAHSSPFNNPTAGDTGAYNIAGGATLRVRDSFRTFAAGSSISGAGNVQFDSFSGGLFNINGGYSIGGTTTIDGNMTVNFNAPVTLSGPVNWLNGTLGGSGSLQTSSVTTVSGAGTKTLGVLAWNNTNTGVVNVDGGTLNVTGALTQSGAVQVASGATFQKSGGFTNAGTLAGTGTFDVGAGGTLANNGTVAPGASPGILTINGNYAQGPSGALAVQIGGTIPGTEHDQLFVTGNASLGGTLNTTLLNNFAPSPGNVFTVIRAGGTVSGTFSTTNFPSGSSLTASYQPSNFDIVFPVPQRITDVVLAESATMTDAIGGAAAPPPEDIPPPRRAPLCR